MASAMTWRTSPNRSASTSMGRRMSRSPARFKERKMLELDPHETIEGMLIAAYAIGSDKVYIYIGGEYPLAIRHFRHAVRQADQAGLIGQNVLGSGFDVEMVVRVGGGAYICGEGSA